MLMLTDLEPNINWNAKHLIAFGISNSHLLIVAGDAVTHNTLTDNGKQTIKYADNKTQRT